MQINVPNPNSHIRDLRARPFQPFRCRVFHVFQVFRVSDVQMFQMFPRSRCFRCFQKRPLSRKNETPAGPAILRICTKSRADTRYRAAEVYENRANGGGFREFFSGTAVAHDSGDHTRVQANLEDLMRKRLGIMAALAVGGALFVGSADVSAQGRGNGKGRGGDKGGGKAGLAGQQQQRSDRESRRQQEWSDWQSREQQRRSDAESRRHRNGATGNQEDAAMNVGGRHARRTARLTGQTVTTSGRTRTASGRRSAASGRNMRKPSVAMKRSIAKQ